MALKLRICDCALYKSTNFRLDFGTIFVKLFTCESGRGETGIHDSLRSCWSKDRGSSSLPVRT